MTIIELSTEENNKTPLLNKGEGWLKTQGLVDLQVNGFAGIDFNSPGLTPDALQLALEAMLATGVTTCLPTIITESETHLRSCLSALEIARKSTPLAKTMLAGFHLEGPFLSKLHGYSGCHPVEEMGVADSEMFFRLQEAAGGNIKMITIAPEVEGAIAFIEQLVEAGIIVALGHTAASSEEIRNAVDTGARLSTHLGNGTSAKMHKSENPIIAQLGDDRLSAGFIADGYHLAPEVLKVYLRAKCAERVILVTDATAGTAAPPGRYSLGNSELQRETEPVILDQKTQRPVGSAVTMDQCVRNVIKWYDMTLEEAVIWAGDNPFQLLNSAKVQTQLSVKEQAVWWEEHEKGWQVKAAQSGQFLFEE
ncbi:MAG: N-acetylglucosamine-6-phosphate deacetylase [SAR324 cluster bacterium]|nr:N-acetylglucosamine-6-phosphate deacetylase [SAR324 cluster bacterium]